MRKTIVILCLIHICFSVINAVTWKNQKTSSQSNPNKTVHYLKNPNTNNNNNISIRNQPITQNYQQRQIINQPAVPGNQQIQIINPQNQNYQKINNPQAAGKIVNPTYKKAFSEWLTIKSLKYYSEIINNK